jgi:hypothetical protein
MAGNAADAMAQRATDFANSAADATHAARDAASDRLDQAYRQAGDFAQSGVQAATQAVKDDGTRNQLLLGVAGLAVAAAVGIACQRRALEEA